MRVRSLALTAILSAVLCVLAPWAFMIGPVPVTLGSFGVCLVAGVAGWKKGLGAVGVYLVLGCVGLPVFSGFMGGAQQLLGPTGGFLMGYLPLALCVGLWTEKGKGKWVWPVSMLLGTLGLYTIGSLWYMAVAKAGLWTAVGVCVLPFLPGDGVKILVCCFCAPKLRNATGKHL